MPILLGYRENVRESSASHYNEFFYLFTDEWCESHLQEYFASATYPNPYIGGFDYYICARKPDVLTHYTETGYPFFRYQRNYIESGAETHEDSSFYDGGYSGSIPLLWGNRNVGIIANKNLFYDFDRSYILGCKWASGQMSEEELRTTSTNYADVEEEKKKLALKTIFTVNYNAVGGVQHKNIMLDIAWNNANVESRDNFNYKIDFSFPNLQSGIHSIESNYNELHYKTDFYSIMENCEPSTYQKILSFLIPIQAWLSYQLEIHFYIKDNSAISPSWIDCGSCLISPSEIPISSSPIDPHEIMFHLGIPDQDEYIEQAESSTSSDLIDIIAFHTSPYNATTKTYKMDNAELTALSNVIWTESFLNNLVLLNENPIENIVGIKMLPFSVNGESENIHIGNVNTNVSGSRVSSPNLRTRVVSNYRIKPFYNSFLDYSPYTSVRLYLAFFGVMELDATSCMGRLLDVDYCFDLVTGEGKANVYIDGLLYNSVRGNIAINIPISARNNSDFLLGIMSSVSGTALSSVGSAIQGNGLGVASSVVGGAMQGATSKLHTSTQGACGGMIEYLSPMDITIQYDRPQYQDLQAFNHSYGRMCNLSLNLGSINGFTKCASDIDMQGFNCSDRELAEIKSLLIDGVYL